MTQNENDFEEWVKREIPGVAAYKKGILMTGFLAGRKITGHVERGWAVIKDGKFVGLWPGKEK
jgi:hypothetical protein